MRGIKVISLAAVAALSATNNGPAVDVSGFDGEGRIILDASAVGGTASPSAAVKIQHSDDGVSGWTDSGVAFQNVGAAASFQTLAAPLKSFKKFVRVVTTLTGTTPTVTRSVLLVGKRTYG